MGIELFLACAWFCLSKGESICRHSSMSLCNDIFNFCGNLKSFKTGPTSVICITKIEINMKA